MISPPPRHLVTFLTKRTSCLDHSHRSYRTNRWAFYKDVISFASLDQSFASMTDVIMLSNWPMFMDAAGDVGGVFMARVFFYSFKVICSTSCDVRVLVVGFATLCVFLSAFGS